MLSDLVVDTVAKKARDRALVQGPHNGGGLLGACADVIDDLRQQVTEPALLPLLVRTPVKYEHRQTDSWAAVKAAGGEGWQVVSTFRAGDGVMYVLCREKPVPADDEATCPGGC